jgi:hypothetical protein
MIYLLQEEILERNRLNKTKTIYRNKKMHLFSRRNTKFILELKKKKKKSFSEQNDGKTDEKGTNKVRISNEISLPLFLIFLKMKNY